MTDALCRSWLDLLGHFDPGQHPPGGAGRLGRFDPASVREFLAAARAIAGAIEELPVEEVADEIDRTALLGEVRHRIARLEHDQPHVRNPGFWLDHLGLALFRLHQPGTDPGLRAEQVLDRLRTVPEFLTAARETIRRPPSELAAGAIAMTPGLVELVHALVERYQPLLDDSPGELAAAATLADAAITRFRMALGAEIAPDEDPHAAGVGEDRYGWILHHHFMLRPSAGEVWRWGRTLAAQVEEEITGIAAEIDPGRPWRDVYESLREDGLVTGDLLAEAIQSLGRLRGDLDSLDLVTPRAGEIAVREAPAWLATHAPFTVYEPPDEPGPSPTGWIHLAAPSAPADPETAAWQRGELDRHRLAVLAAHDGWPGRHTQALAALATSSLVRRTIASPLTVAGWGCYAEELMVEAGPLAGPADRLAQRVLLLIRALRVTVDAGIHGRMLTPAAAVDLLMERVPMDHHAAVAEVRRACAEPGAAAAYALGRREILELRADWRRGNGSGVPLRYFHEAVLAHGRLPVSLVRWGMGVE